MQIRRFTVLFVLCSAFMSGGLRQIANAQEAQPSSQSEEISASNTWLKVGERFAGLLNTAEINYKRENGKFASDMELYKSGEISSGQAQLVKEMGISKVRSLRWAFHVSTSANGDAYQLMVYRASPLKCQTAFFSSDDRVIYQGKPIGCNKNPS
jgi:hypothetical protein